MPVTENSSLLFSACNLELLFWKIVNFLLVILTNNKQKLSILEDQGPPFAPPQTNV